MAQLDLSHLDLPVLDVDEFERRKLYDMDFYNNFGRDKTSALFEKINRQMSSRRNYILGIYGLPGTVKSYDGMEIIGEANLNLNIDTIFFRVEDIDKYRPKLKPRDVVVSDENVPIYGTGEKRLEADYKLMIETLRKEQICFFLISVRPRAIDHCWHLIQALQLVDEDRQMSYSELQNNQMDCIGHIELQNPLHSKYVGRDFIEQYEEKKDQFLAEVKKLKSTDYLSEYAYKVIDSDDFKNMDNQGRKGSEKSKTPYRGIHKPLLRELVNILYPNLRRNNEVDVIVEKIRAIMILKRKWQL
jgi:hypothetical protein